MRVALDATPLLGRPTGVGRYVAGLVEGLRALPEPPEVVLTAFSRSGGAPAVAGARWSSRRVPARALQALWSRVDLPPVEWLSGRCDVFHATNFVLPPRRRAAGVVTVHDLTFLTLPDLVTPTVLRYRTLVPRAVRSAQAVLTPSAAVAREVERAYGLGEGSVRVARPGVSPAWAQAQPLTAAELAARGLPPSYVLAVGTLEPRKGLPLLLAAHARLRRQDAGAPPLVLVGPQGWGEALQAEPGQVVLTGWVDDDVLRRLVAGAACLAFPSRYEGYGLPPLEALACGTPVVCSDLPVLREVLGDVVTYADPEDEVGFAAALAGVLADDGGAPARAARRAHAALRTPAAFAAEADRAYRAALG